MTNRAKPLNVPRSIPQGETQGVGHGAVEHRTEAAPDAQ